MKSSNTKVIYAALLTILTIAFENDQKLNQFLHNNIVDYLFDVLANQKGICDEYSKKSFNTITSFLDSLIRTQNFGLKIELVCHPLWGLLLETLVQSHTLERNLYVFYNLYELLTLHEKQRFLPKLLEAVSDVCFENEGMEI